MKWFRSFPNFLVMLTTAAVLSNLPVMALPANDNFANAQSLTGTNLVFTGSNVGATGEPGEPPPPATFLNLNTPPTDVTNSVWFKWTAPASGGVVVEVKTTGAFTAPMMGVYTNSTLATLGLVAANSINFSDSRVAFTAASNTTYRIAVQGSDLAGAGTNQGSFTGTLVETPPPANNLFTNRSVISGVYFTAAGSFLGADREPGEPAGLYPQTLWWTWTAPTNLGNTSIPVRLMADSVNWNPAISVYTGSVVSALSAVPTTTRTNAFASAKFSATRIVTFLATPGVAYQISVAGYGGDPGGLVISPRFGNYRFRLNAGGLTLTLTNFTATDNFDGGDYDSWNFSGTAIVVNSGPATSKPLRLRAFTSSGVSVLGSDSGYAPTNQSYCFTNVFGPLTNGQSISMTVTGTIPAAVAHSEFIGDGYGAYAELDEQPFASSWFAVDQLLIGYADWPTLFGSTGPGAGAIRLDPGSIGLSAFNPMTSVSILGPSNVFEGSSMTYTGKAVFADSSVFQFTNTIWSAAPFNITTNGNFTAGSVTSNTPVVLGAQYYYSGLLYTTATNIVVSNLPPPQLSGVSLTPPGKFVFNLQGVPGRNHVIEAATNLSPATWLPLFTNQTSSGGLLIYTNFQFTNFPARYFRAREM